MLPDHIKPKNFATLDIEPWPEYVRRLSLPGDYPLRQFYRQIVYDHFDHFNDHYPDFDINERELVTVQMKATDFAARIRYFDDKPMDWWRTQYDEFRKTNYDYEIYQEMTRNLTFPYPPIVIDSAFLVDNEWCVYGRPLHLVEGPHRVSYLMRMVELGLVTKESMHEIVYIK